MVTINIERVRSYMREHDINSTQMAELIGVSPSCISRFLNGKREPNGKVVLSLIGHFGERIVDYIFLNENVSKDTKGGGGGQ